jgi:hypothetical protein
VLIGEGLVTACRRFERVADVRSLVLGRNVCYFNSVLESQHKHAREDNIKVDLKEVGWKVMGWIELAPDRDMWQALVNAVMNLRTLKMRGIC